MAYNQAYKPGNMSGQHVSDAYLQLDTGTKTGSATSGAATLNKMSGVITSESLNTAAGATYTLTLTNSKVAAADVVMADVFNGSNSGGQPCLATVTPGSNQIVFIVQNIHGSAAFSGTIKLSFVVFKN